MQLWLIPLLAFLLGSIPFGLLIARAKGINIREHGSGNIGATNVFRVVGKKYGILCLLLDALKGLVPTILGISLISYAGQSNPMQIEALHAHAHVFPAEQQWLAQLLQVFTALLAILGHNYSPWIGFKGGKGIATTAGVLIALAPFSVILLLLVWVIVLLATRYVSVASITASALLPFSILLGSWHHGKLAAGTWNKPLLAFAFLVAALAIWKHRGNIQRLRAGTENQFRRS